MKRFLNTNPHLAEMLKGGLLSLLLRCSAAGFGFLLIVVVSRWLGAELAGHYFLVITVITIVSTLVRLGLDLIITRQVATAVEDQNWGAIRQLYKLSMLSVGLVALFVAVFLWQLGDFFAKVVFDKPQIMEVWGWLMAALMPFALYMLHGFFFQGLKRVSGLIFAQTLGLSVLMLTALLMVYLADVSLTLELLAKCYTAASLAVFLILAFAWRKVFLKNAVGGEKSEADLTRVVSSASKLWAVQSIGILIQWMPILLLGVWALSSEVAIYTAAARTALLTSIILSSVNAIAAPKFAAQYHKGDIEGLQQIAVWSTRLMLLACAPIIGGLLIFPEFVLSLFGEDFVAGASVLMILALGQLINVATGSVGFLLSMTGHEKRLLATNVATITIMLALCLVLIPLYGMIGAAIAQALSVSIQMLINSWSVKQKLGFMPLNIFKV